LRKKAKTDLLPLQPSDVPDTCADSTELEKADGYKPNTPVKVGAARFVEWYREFYGV
jgi:UDP-glucuronate 4-epimerase